jgi:hypothetical protein
MIPTKVRGGKDLLRTIEVQVPTQHQILIVPRYSTPFWALLATFYYI